MAIASNRDLTGALIEAFLKPTGETGGVTSEGCRGLLRRDRPLKRRGPNLKRRERMRKLEIDSSFACGALLGEPKNAIRLLSPFSAGERQGV